MKSSQEATRAGERTLMHRMVGILDSCKSAETLNAPKAAQRLAPHVDAWTARYKTLREAGKRLHEMAVQRLSKPAINDFAQRIGILRNGILVFDSEHEMEVVLDFAIYNQQQNGLTGFEEIARDAPPTVGSDEYLLLMAALKSYHTLVMITDVIPGFGVEVADILHNEQFLLADVNFSRTATPGVSLATRVKPVGDFWMSSGASLSIMNEQVLTKIDDYLKRFFPKTRDFRQLDPRRKAELQGFIIRTCLQSQTAQHFVSADPDSEEAAMLLREGRATDEEGQSFKIGRNDPCPCGSGQKYKKCCGRGLR